MNFFNDFFGNVISVFKTFSFSDAVDIFIVALIIFAFISIVRETRTVQLIKGIFILIVFWFLSRWFQLGLLNSLLNHVFEFSVIAILLVFQPEVRNALEKIGRTNVSGYIGSVTRGSSVSAQQKLNDAVSVVCRVATDCSKSKTGALIVFERRTRLKEIADTGTYINADISVELVENIFFNKAPLHDGAMIIRDSLILAAGCILPLTKNNEINSSLGTRHRAGIGMSENSDAVVLIISEETGTISLAIGGNVVRNFSEKSLQNELLKLLSSYNTEKEKKSVFSSLFRRQNSDEEN